MITLFLTRCMAHFKILQTFIHQQIECLRRFLTADVYFGKFIDRVPDGSIVFFPCRQATLFCGIAG
ncbi:MAG: hypothetical protein PVG52_09865, partial [Desulfobacterales bacterium]